MRCCDNGDMIEWMEANAIYGPEHDGPAMVCGSEDYGAANTYINVNFCPFCGAPCQHDPQHSATHQPSVIARQSEDTVDAGESTAPTTFPNIRHVQG